jgi:hypothetical protein
MAHPPQPAPPATASAGDWSALSAIASEHFRTLRQAHAGWSIAELFVRSGILPTPHLCALAAQAGFVGDAAVESAPNRVLRHHHLGVWSTEIISEETGIARDEVEAILAAAGGYGSGGYGSTPYGHNRATADGETAVLRRVSAVGQMSYRGHQYSLGQPYRGRIATLLEHGAIILASFGDRPTLRLAARHFQRTGAT